MKEYKISLVDENNNVARVFMVYVETGDKQTVKEIFNDKKFQSKYAVAELISEY